MKRIVIDTSALAAILLAEPERESFLVILENCEQALISTATVVEARMILHVRRGQAGVLLLDELLSLPPIEQIPPGAAESLIAYQAFVRFGKGRHPAALNLGDLFAYALAKSRNLPLLFKGNDFSQTDLERAA